MVIKIISLDENICLRVRNKDYAKFTELRFLDLISSVVYISKRICYLGITTKNINNVLLMHYLEQSFSEYFIFLFTVFSLY